MEDSLLFVLQDDVEFIPVSAVDYKTKSHFRYEESDVVITHFHTRKSSKIIDTDSAELLKEFKTPRTWADVIFQFARVNQKDPQQVAEEAYGLLVDMQRDGFLVPFKQAAKKEAGALFGLRERFKGYLITEQKRLLDDTEVYFAQDGSGKNYVLKFIKQLNEGEIPNEVRMLKMLDGRVNLELKDDGRYGDAHYMVTEWFESSLCKEEADRYRNYYIRGNVIKAFDLCINILAAYRHLHNQGILHGDINDENILVSPSGNIKIIDYNVAVAIGESTAVREGVCYYYEPELAATRLQEEEDAPATARGEQYAIAAVLYYMLAGRHYIDFSVEKEKLYRQVLEEGPVSFGACDLNLPVELDTVFATALAKNPADRFASLDEFIAAMTSVRQIVFSANNYFVHDKSHSEEQFLRFITDTYGWESGLMKKGLSLPPTRSVNFGASGIAYMFYRMACIREDPRLLDLADLWSNRANGYRNNPDRSFYSDDIEINENSVGNRSLYHSAAGIHLVQGLISSCRGDQLSLHQSLDEYIRTTRQPCDKLDLTLGKAGLLLGFAILYQDLKSAGQADARPLLLSANQLSEDLWKKLDPYPDVKEAQEVDYFGIAHGWAGLLYASLYWCSVSGAALPVKFMDRVEQLMKCGVENKNGVSWPVTIKEQRPWTGWCNGSAGHVFLWSLLFKQFKEPAFLGIAERTAQHLLQNTGSGNYNLCCGMSGQAYALLSLYNLTGDKNYLDKAGKLRQAVLANLSFASERFNSLYKSMPGAAVLFCEMERPALARMPLFE